MEFRLNFKLIIRTRMEFRLNFRLIIRKELPGSLELSIPNSGIDTKVIAEN